MSKQDEFYEKANRAMDGHAMAGKIIRGYCGCMIAVPLIFLVLAIIMALINP